MKARVKTAIWIFLFILLIPSIGFSIKSIDRFIKVGPNTFSDGTDKYYFPDNNSTDDLAVDSITVNDLTASRMVSSDSSKVLASISDLTTWVGGTSNEITSTSDGDGTLTLSGAGSDTDFTVITALQAGGVGAIGLQYKTRALTLNGGIITTVGNESDWNDL